MPTPLDSTELRKLFGEAKRNGFAIGSVRDGNAFRSLIGLVGLSLISNRQGAGEAATLRVLDTFEARPGSMSQTVGLGSQPLHTDGAHLHHPPDYVVLIAESANDTPTRYWQPTAPYQAREDLSHGIFKVNTGKSAFLSSAISPRHLRFDPVCMHPLDARAREVVQVLTPNDESTVSAHSWADTDLNLLILNNRTTLHGRAEVTPGDDLRELVRFNVEETHS